MQNAVLTIARKLSIGESECHSENEEIFRVFAIPRAESTPSRLLSGIAREDNSFDRDIYIDVNGALSRRGISIMRILDIMRAA